MACSSRANRPHAPLAALALLLVACPLSTACGKPGAGPPRGATTNDARAAPAGPDLSTPSSTMAVVARALEAGDFEALASCSTAEGIERVRRDLLAWKAMLTDRTAGPRAAVRIPSPRDEAEGARYAAGLKGDPSGLLSMLARAQASDAGPVARFEVAAPAAGVERVETDRALPDGTRRRVVLVLRDGAWKVDRLAL